MRDRRFPLATRGVYDAAMKLLRILYLLAALLALAGCETTRGVQRTVRLNPNQRVPQGAIIAAIDATPGVMIIQKQHLTPTTGYGRVDFHNKSTDRFAYVSDQRHADGVIEVGGNDRDGLKLRMYCFFKNTRPSAEQIDATRKLMDDIYANLRREVPSLPPSDKVHEDLLDVPATPH